MKPLSSSRLLALDVFRGLTICFMIIVNSPGGGAIPFAPLLHADWNGFTPTDLVFPGFLFAVGNAMSFAEHKYKNLETKKVLKIIFKRTILIFLIGYLMYWFPFFDFSNKGIFFKPIANTRILGVLQRIALCYLIVSLITYYFKRITVIILSVIFLLSYWGILYLFGDSQNPLSITGNASGFLDMFVFGESHLYHTNGIAFDPEGILSTLPALVNVIIGYYVGVFIQNKKDKGYHKLYTLFIYGVLFIIIALLWNIVFPINKKLWTSSFVLLTSGINLIILYGLVYVTEIKNNNTLNWTNFFCIFGKNSLFIYVLSEILIVIFYTISIGNGQSLHDWFSEIFQTLLTGAMGSLSFAVSFTLLCWFIGWILDKNKIYIKV